MNNILNVSPFGRYIRVTWTGKSACVPRESFTSITIVYIGSLSRCTVQVWRASATNTGTTANVSSKYFRCKWKTMKRILTMAFALSRWAKRCWRSNRKMGLNSIYWWNCYAASTDVAIPSSFINAIIKIAEAMHSIRKKKKRPPGLRSSPELPRHYWNYWFIEHGYLKIDHRQYL